MRFHWSKHSGDWRIGFGISNFLVAKGAGWSTRLGRALLDELRKPGIGSRRPIRKRIVKRY